MELRSASEADLPQLAAWNRELIEDEGADNPMTVGQLELRMRGWLRGDYEAAVFEERGAPVAYALFRPDEGGVYLRQFFVARAERRRGVGREAFALFRARCVPRGAVLALDVLIYNQRACEFWRAVGMREHAVGFRLP
ncbi:MAG TPA: GNAT family N-acetyltransferase [Myxococcota bacterium]|nr:GNAT family N-acetyltransferase [Myxococcota bacterium]